MSFGYSIGDFIAVIELVKELRSRFVDAPPQYQAINEEFVLFLFVSFPEMELNKI